MAIEDIFDFVDQFIEDGEDEDGGGNTKVSETYLGLWQRMNLVVRILVREKRKEEATKCIVAFFGRFDDMDKLEDLVIESEEALTRPQKVSPPQELGEPIVMDEQT